MIKRLATGLLITFALLLAAPVGYTLGASVVESEPSVRLEGGDHLHGVGPHDQLAGIMIGKPLEGIYAYQIHGNRYTKPYVLNRLGLEGTVDIDLCNGLVHRVVYTVETHSQDAGDALEKYLLELGWEQEYRLTTLESSPGTKAVRHYYSKVINGVVAYRYIHWYGYWQYDSLHYITGISTVPALACAGEL